MNRNLPPLRKPNPQALSQDWVWSHCNFQGLRMEMIVAINNVNQNTPESRITLCLCLSLATNNHFKVFSALMELQLDLGKLTRGATATVTQTAVTSSKGRNWAGDSSTPPDSVVYNRSPRNLGSGLHVKTWQNQTRPRLLIGVSHPTQSPVTKFERNLRIVINSMVSGVQNAFNTLSFRKKCLLLKLSGDISIWVMYTLFKHDEL